MWKNLIHVSDHQIKPIPSKKYPVFKTFALEKLWFKRDSIEREKNKNKKKNDCNSVLNRFSAYFVQINLQFHNL